MIVRNVEFKRTPKYEEILDKIKGGANVYLQGAVGTGKSTMVRELQYDLDINYCYCFIKRDVNCHTLNQMCEQIALQLNIEVERTCVGGVYPEGTLTAIKQTGKKILFVFDEIDNVAYSHPDVVESINEWLHDLCVIEGCQVICVGQNLLNKSLPYFFANKSWRQLFDIMSVESEIIKECGDIKTTIKLWFESELLRGEYPESLLKLISMGISGEMSLRDAVKAASVFC